MSSVKVYNATHITAKFLKNEITGMPMDYVSKSDHNQEVRLLKAQLEFAVKKVIKQIYAGNHLCPDIEKKDFEAELAQLKEGGNG